MLYNGEQIGDGSPPDRHRGRPDRRHDAHLARPAGRHRGDRAERAGHDVQPRPVRLHGEDRGRPGRGRRDRPQRAGKANLEAVAKALGEQVSDVTAVILDRDRHADIIRECREAGARIRLIPDGDVAGAISVAWRNSGTDVLFGIGGTPEGVIAACALKCLGGSIQGRLGRATTTSAAPRSTWATTSTGCSRSTTSSRGDDVLLRRDRHHRRRAAPGRALLGRRREHAEPRDALEVGNDPHHRRDPPLDEAACRTRRSGTAESQRRQLHVHCTNSSRRALGVPTAPTHAWIGRRPDDAPSSPAAPSRSVDEPAHEP